MRPRPTGPAVDHPPAFRVVFKSTPSGRFPMPTSEIDRLHRAATIECEEGEAEPAAPVMLAGVALSVELIGQRDWGRAFHEAIAEQNEYAG